MTTRFGSGLVGVGVVLAAAIASAQTPQGPELELAPGWSSGLGLAFGPSGTLVLFHTHTPGFLDCGDFVFPDFQTRGFGPDGAALGPPSTVSTPGFPSLWSGSIAAAADGSYVVAWEDLNGIYARALDSEGLAVGEIGRAAPDGSGRPALAAADERMALAWAERGAIRALLLDGSGLPVGPPFVVDDGLHSDQPATAVGPHGETIVVWGQEGAPAPGGTRIDLARLDSTGSPLGPPLRVDDVDSGTPSGPEVAIARDGSALVVWTSLADAGDAGLRRGIQARAFRPDGSPLAQRRIDANPTGDSYTPAVVALEEGGFMVAWSEQREPSAAAVRSIQARQLRADGFPAGPARRVDEGTTGRRHAPMLALRPGGDVLVGWSSVPVLGICPVLSAVRARMVSVDPPAGLFADDFESGDLSVWSESARAARGRGPSGILGR